MFASFKAELPLMTRILIAFSDFFVAYWPLHGRRRWSAAVFGVRAYVRHAGGALPLGPAQAAHAGRRARSILKATLARFSRSFALAGRSGVPIVQALALVAERGGQRLSRRAHRAACATASSAARASCAPRSHAGVFTPVVLQMVAVGEETGEIDALMAEIADMYEREVNIEVDGLAAKDRADPPRAHGRAWC